MARWGIVYFEENGEAPARAWLESLPEAVQFELLKTVDAVVSSLNPLGFPASGPRWRSMRDEKGVDLGNFCEARDKEGKRLHRLFCRFDSRAVEHGLSHPVIVLVEGATKELGEALGVRDYRAVIAAWERYCRTPRRSTAVSFPPSLPPVSGT